jgi:Tfp pilus assembly protein PilO
MVMADILLEKRRLMNLVGVCCVLGGVLAPSAFAAIHFFTVARDKVKASAALQESLSELDGLNKTLGEVEAARKQTESRLAEAETRLPNSQSMDDFLAQIAKVEENAGLVVDSTTFDRNMKDSGSYKSLPVCISGAGNWDTCYKFMTGLRAMNRLTRLDSMSLEVLKNGTDGKPLDLRPGQEPPCQITINISTFMAR